nr:VWA domain-containing protein [Rhodovulum imhoffii]
MPDTPRLWENIAHFARALRVAGLPAGPGQVVRAVEAVQAAGFTERADFYYTLQACFTNRPEHRAVFAQAFRLYWRDPRFLEHMMSLLLPAMRGVAEEHHARPGERRAAQALLEGVERRPPDMPPPPEVREIEASRTWSARERLKTLDFEQMTGEEQARALRMLKTLRLPVPPVLGRRTVPQLAGRLPDWRTTARASLRQGGEIRRFACRDRCRRPLDLVVLCDISGSMSSYARMVLHFVHAVASRPGPGWGKVQAFTFGTRLTNITRQMHARDADAALAAAGAEARDWDGGTRIASAIREFNRKWSRRVLAGGAVVVLITDGLDRDLPDILSREVERLRLSCRHLVWINPLLRWEGFAPKARGIKAILPHVDSFRPGHNLRAIEDLAHAIGQPRDAGVHARMMTLL